MGGLAIAAVPYVRYSKWAAAAADPDIAEYGGYWSIGAMM